VGARAEQGLFLDTSLIATERSLDTALSGAVLDLGQKSLREVNGCLHAIPETATPSAWRIINPRGRHALAAGLNAPLTVEIAGHVGYYCAGMNQQARIIIHGNAGVGVGENMMSGFVLPTSRPPSP
jgi:methylamine---glutamate N-methyltransferase subunit B